MALLSRLRAATQPHIIRSSLRSYGSAAAQIDYDYDDDYEYYEETRVRSGVMEESEGSVPRRGVQWVVMGDPMAQRHVYAQWLSKLLDVPHISMGSLVRQELHPRSSIYKQIAEAVNQGKLVPEDVIFGLLSKRLEEGFCRGESGFILDGIPRSKIQAEILDKTVDIDLVLNLKCAEGEMSKKDKSTGLYSPLEFLRRTSGINMSLQPEGGHFRPSNTMNDVSRKKLHVHAEQIKPLEEYYRKQRKLLDFQVAGGPGETWQGLLAALHLQHRNAVGSTQLSAGC
ncbi:putative adenylate kinase 7, mitochondrial [Nicotiana tabacum]|uniref:adenylate kinase n=1 Tax=Nicotiana tabacum TaxID=4097 RepID=A0A1S4B5C7_TOBAC|nr:probable adenylate kinase 7, mitochondrial [Nicotiana tomentosiformis]XP_016484057.1 PREDICTED: probable adenylate kinase 7, mitochondrial [Nicotiana tabacum]